MDEHLQMICDKMSEMAGYDPKDVDWKSDSHLDLTWTKEQEDEYTKWLCDLLYNDAKMRRNVMAFPAKNKAQIKKTVDQFLFYTGFKTIEYEKTSV